jgi:hypothetical protein
LAAAIQLITAKSEKSNSETIAMAHLGDVLRARERAEAR